MKEKRIEIDIQPVCLKVLSGEEISRYHELEQYRGVSFCDAVRLSSQGKGLLVTPDSIEVCGWAPYVLGLKEPIDEFSLSLEPRLSWPVAGLCLVPMSLFEGIPDVVIVRGRREVLDEVIRLIGADEVQRRYHGMIGKSALGLHGKAKVRVFLGKSANKALSRLRELDWFTRLTHFLFRSGRITSIFEKATKNAFADMSICRNSTVIPILEDAVNISFFCVGGITWGGNNPNYLTAGFPGRLAPVLREILEFPSDD